ncbi:MAG: ABC transporter permease [Williamsia sp.]|nr:ABC transporter permease [Williamsia sp.]
MKAPVQSISSPFWRKLKKNRGALFGMTVIACAFLLAPLAYLVAPDHTPYANRMIVEIEGRRPGYAQLFLKKKKETAPPVASFFQFLVNGKEDAYTYIPVTGYQAANRTVAISRYIDKGVTDTVLVPVSSLASPLSSNFVRLHYWLGTDKYGRDILSRLIVGTRVSLGVGLIAIVISLTIGIVLGGLAGYYGGRVDSAVMWLVNVVWSIPTLLLVFAITLLLGKGFWQVFVAVGLTMWVSVARLVRGQVLVARQLEWAEVARALGYTDARILFRHILPNILGPVFVLSASNFASAIIIEAGLSFLGVGVQPPQPSWGLMIKENYNFIITHNPVLALAPGFAVMLLVLAFNLLGNGLRDALDVRE